MKKFILALIATLLLCTGISSCYRHRNDKPRKYSHAELVEDSAWFSQMLEMCHPDKFDKAFEDVTEVEYYQDNELWLKELENDFLSIDPQTLANICKVLHKNGKKLTVLNIMDEYNGYKHVYDNINDEDDPPVATHTDTIEEMAKLDVPQPEMLNK